MIVAPSLLLIVAVPAIVICQDPTTAEPLPVEPPFPKVFDLVGRSVQVVSTYWDHQLGYGTVAEYLDLDVGRAAYEIRLGETRHNVLLDAVKDRYYIYRPYRCQVGPQGALEEAALDTWAFDLPWQPRESRLHLFDAIGLWVFASQNAFTYAHGQQLYSHEKSRVRQRLHTWSFNDTARKVRLDISFVETATNGKEQPTFDLRSIRKSTSEGALLRTYDVMKVEPFIDRDVHDTVLQLPVGHQCSTSENERNDLDVRTHNGTARKLGLQVTATKFSNLPGGQAAGRDTDTVHLDVAHRLQSDGAYFMFRLRDTRTDIKHVVDYESARYEVDLVRGNCTIGRASSREEDEAFELVFANGMRLGVELALLTDLLDDMDGYGLVKEVGYGSTKFAFFEKTLTDFDRPTRVIKKFSSSQDGARYDLSSVTIWHLNDNEDLIDEMVYFSVVDDQSDEAWSESSSEYDISEECYLNNDAMQSGRDYAWLEFRYPLDGREIGLIAAHSELVKQQLHRKLAGYLGVELHYHIQLPRIELAFDDDDMVVRLLALEWPPAETRRDRISLQKIVSEARRLDYSPLELPEPPEELLLDRPADLSDTHRQVAGEYVANTLRYIAKERPGLQGLALVIDLRGVPVVLAPSGFVREPADDLDGAPESGRIDEDEYSAPRRGTTGTTFSRSIQLYLLSLLLSASIAFGVHLARKSAYMR